MPNQQYSYIPKKHLFFYVLRLMSGEVEPPGSSPCVKTLDSSTVAWWVGPTGLCSMTFTLTCGT